MYSKTSCMIVCMYIWAIVQYGIQWHYITLQNSHLPLPTGISLKHISSQCWWYDHYWHRWHKMQVATKAASKVPPRELQGYCTLNVTWQYQFHSSTGPLYAISNFSWQLARKIFYYRDPNILYIDYGPTLIVQICIW